MARIRDAKKDAEDLYKQVEELRYGRAAAEEIMYRPGGPIPTECVICEHIHNKLRRKEAWEIAGKDMLAFVGLTFLAVVAVLTAWVAIDMWYGR